MGLVSGVGKIVLIVVNLIIFIVALVMLVGGIVVVSGSGLVDDYIKDMEDDLKKAFTDTGVTVNTDDMDIVDLIVPMAYALIAVGIIIGAIALLGLLGTCCTIKLLLVVYTIIILLFFIVQLVFVVVIYTDRSALDSTLKDQIKDTLKDYSGIEGEDAKTLAWNALMVQLSCCGIDNYKDFNGLSKWPPATIKGNAINGLGTPILCCKSLSTNYDCAKAATMTSSNNNMDTGCYNKLFDNVTENEFVLTVIVILLACQFVLVFFSIWILCTMDNKVDII